MDWSEVIREPSRTSPIYLGYLRPGLVQGVWTVCPDLVLLVRFMADICGR